MNTHYIPRLLLRPFAVGERINTYNFTTNTFEHRKLKNTFSEDNLFDEELEKLFASKLEGPFGNLLNNKLLHTDSIKLNRQENLLLRKFLMINFLRAPIVNTDWNEMLERTQLQNHPSVQAREFLMRHHLELKEEFEKEIAERNVQEMFLLLGRKKPEEIPGYLTLCDAAFISFADNP